MKSQGIHHFVSGIILSIIFAQTTLPSVAMDDALLEKPEKTGAILWLQQLEKKRDIQASRIRTAGNDEASRLFHLNHYEALTKEIGATISGKYGISERLATPEEQIVIMHSIIRTRRGFLDRNNMLHDFYLSYNRSKTNVQLGTDTKFKDHMVAVLAIDSMAMKAFVDDDFEELWSKANTENIVSQDFISGVVSHSQAYEKREVFEPLSQHLQKFLQTRHNIVHFAYDVFSVFAPKIGLKQFCSEIIINGTYRGWDIHGGSDFTNIVTLADIINSRSDLEDLIRDPQIDPVGGVKSVFWKMVSEYSPGSDIPINTSSGRLAIPPSDELRRKFNLNPDEMIVHYVYDPDYFLARMDITASQKRTFYFSRSVKNPLIVQLLTGVVLQSPVGVMLDTESSHSTTEEERVQTANANQRRPIPSAARTSPETARPQVIPRPTPEMTTGDNAIILQQRLVRREPASMVRVEYPSISQRDPE